MTLKINVGFLQQITYVIVIYQKVQLLQQFKTVLCIYLNAHTLKLYICKL